jgi:pimeloyl-ACP methyl ester carboxylesterase
MKVGALCAALALLGAAAPTSSPQPSAATTLHIDAAYVTKTGSGPQAVIFLPGLASGAYVWDGLASGLASRYTVYTITFAGFDGEPPVAPPYLNAFDRSVVDLISQEQLKSPVLVGHDLGGHLVFRLAEELGDAIGGAFVIDGLPAFPPQRPGESKADRIASAAKYRDSIVSASPAAYAADVKELFATLVSDPKTVDLLASRSVRSDQATFAGSAYEYFLADLRSAFGRIAVPMVLLVPGENQESAEATADAYELLCVGIPKIDVIGVAPSKHFIMYDRPDRVRQALEAYLNSLGL